MALGEKIRQARLEKGLSQRQLCGDTITRNMLSQIENGSARPSMDTLQFLSRQLEKPISWFLDEQATRLPNLQAMENARDAFRRQDWQRLRQSLSVYQAPDPVFDPERYLLEVLSLMAQAAEVAGEKPVYARSLLEKAWQTGLKTPYFTQPHRREWVLLMSRIDPDAPGLLSRLPGDDRELLLRARAAKARGELSRCLAALEAVENRDAEWHLLRGEVAMVQKDYRQAVPAYTAAEACYPKESIQALEICYRELEDYKMAYQYACKLRQL